MRRGDINLLATISFYFGLSAAALLVLSFVWVVAVLRRHGGRSDAVFAEGGRIAWGWVKEVPPPGAAPPTPAAVRWETEAERWSGVRFAPGRLAWAAVRFDRVTYTRPVTAAGGVRSATVYVPLWCPAVLGLVPPLVLARAGRRRRRRLAAGLCRRCGYDLRGTPHRCPECGALPAVVRPA